MNPVILKALIISGGTIGLGVPSIYYGYPHIAKLVSPSTGAQQEQSGELGSMELAENVTKEPQLGTPKGGEISGESGGKNLATNAENIDTATSLQDNGQEQQKGKDNATPEGGGASDSRKGNSSEDSAPAPLPPQGTLATRGNSDQREQ